MKTTLSKKGEFPEKKGILLALALLCGIVSPALSQTIAVNWPRAVYQETIAPKGLYSWTYQPTNIPDTNRWFFLMDNLITTNGLDFYSANIPAGIETPSWITYQFAGTLGGTNIAKWEGRLLYDRAALFANAPIGKLTGQPWLMMTTNKP